MAANQSEAYQEILKEMTPLFAKIPDTDIYEIVSEIKPKVNEFGSGHFKFIVNLKSGSMGINIT